MTDEAIDFQVRLLRGRLHDSDLDPFGEHFDPTRFLTFRDVWVDDVDPDEFMRRPHVLEALRLHEARDRARRRDDPSPTTTSTTTMSRTMSRRRGDRPPAPLRAKGDESDERGVKQKR